MGTTIGRMRAPPYQAPPFELVDEADHRVAVHFQQVGEFLLTAPVTARKVRQDPEMGRLDPERGEPLGEPARDMMTDLGQQEGAAIVQWLIQHTRSIAI